MKIAPLCAVLAFSLSMPALAQSTQPGKVCLRQDMVYGWDVVNDRTLVVTNRLGKKFTVALRPGCFNLKFNERLGFKAFGGSGLSCLGPDDYVLVPPSAGQPPQRCFISNIQAYNANAATPSK